jgi:hypothetical protein
MRTDGMTAKRKRIMLAWLAAASERSREVGASGSGGAFSRLASGLGFLAIFITSLAVYGASEPRVKLAHCLIIKVSEIGIVASK